MSETTRTRLYTANACGAILHLADSESLEVRRSLRLQKGDQVGIFNGDGMEYCYRIEESSPKEMQLTLLERYTNPLDDLPETTVFIAATKGKTKDRMVKDLTPLGVTRIAFFLAERSVSHPEGHQESRLQKIAVEACRQCGRSSIPRVEIMSMSLFDLCVKEKNGERCKLFFWEKAASDQTLPDFPFDSPLSLFFGPEGGFTNDETACLMQHQAIVVSLGRRILRSELAVVVGMTLVQAKRGVF